MPSCEVHRIITSLVLEFSSLPGEVKKRTVEFVCEADEVDKRDYYADVVSYAGKRPRRLKPKYGVVRHHASPELLATAYYYTRLAIYRAWGNDYGNLPPVLARLLHYYQDIVVPYKGTSGSHAITEDALQKLLTERNLLKLKNEAKTVYSEVMSNISTATRVSLEEELDLMEKRLAKVIETGVVPPLTPDEILKEMVRNTAMAVAVIDASQRNDIKERMLVKKKLAEEEFRKYRRYASAFGLLTVITFFSCYS